MSLIQPLDSAFPIERQAVACFAGASREMGHFSGHMNRRDCGLSDGFCSEVCGGGNFGQEA